MRVSTGAMCHLHYLNSLLCTLDVAEIVIVVTILKEDVVLLDLDTILLVANRVLLIRGLGIVSNVGGVNTSLRNTGRKLIDLSGHNKLILILLPLMILIMLLHLLI